MNAGEKSLLKALDQGGIVALFFQPLLQKNNNEYGGHDKIQPLGIQLDKRTEWPPNAEPENQ